LSVNFVDTLGFSIVMPFLVFIVERFGGNAFAFGIVSACYSAFQMMAAPLLGRWSDLAGRRRVLLFCEIGSLIGWLLLAVAVALPPTGFAHIETAMTGSLTLSVPLLLTFASRAIAGATGGSASIANAYVADISRSEEQSRNFGYMSVSSNLGFVIGPAAAGVLGATGWGETLPIAVASVAAIAAALMVGVWLPESKPCLLTSPPGAGSIRKVFGQEPKDCVALHEAVGWKETLEIPSIRALLWLYFWTFMAFNLYYAAFPVYAVRDLGWNVGGTGSYFAVLSMLMVLVQGPVLSYASKHVAPATLIVVGSGLLAACFLMLISDTLLAVGASAVLFAIGNGLMWPSVVATFSKTAGERFQGAAQGLAGSTGSLASILGLVGGGFAYQHLQRNTFLLASLCILGAGLISMMLPKGSRCRMEVPRE
jgi:MFS family permease